MERVAGIEPAYSAWKADVLPLNYTRLNHSPRSTIDLPKLKTGFRRKNLAIWATNTKHEQISTKLEQTSQFNAGLKQNHKQTTAFNYLLLFTNGSGATIEPLLDNSATLLSHWLLSKYCKIWRLKQSPYNDFLPAKPFVIWWREVDLNHRSLRVRFTVWSLWPLGNPSKKSAVFSLCKPLMSTDI